MPITGSGWVDLKPTIGAGHFANPLTQEGIGPFGPDDLAVIIENRVPGCAMGIQNIGDNASGRIGGGMAFWTIPPLHRGTIPLNPYGGVGVIIGVYPLHHVLNPTTDPTKELTWACPYVVVDDPQTFQTEPLFPEGSLVPVVYKANLGNDFARLSVIPFDAGGFGIDIGDDILGSGQAYIMQVNVRCLTPNPVQDTIEGVFDFGGGVGQKSDIIPFFDPTLMDSVNVKLPGALNVNINSVIGPGLFLNDYQLWGWIGVLP